MVRAAHLIRRLRARFDAWAALPGDRFWLVGHDVYLEVSHGRPGALYGRRVTGLALHRRGNRDDPFERCFAAAPLEPISLRGALRLHPRR